MDGTRRCGPASVALVLVLLAEGSLAQNVEYETRDGVRYQVTRQVVQQQVPTTVMQDRQQVQYTQQVTTDTVSHQQTYCVPVTQYELRSELRGRWNPFVTPYWTHRLEPVTHWQEQVANVQIPVNRVSWVPQTTTVQVPVTQYKTAEKEIITRVAVSDARAGTDTAVAQQSRPTATIAARPARPASAIGGIALENDPPRQATSWQTPPDNSRYR